jgi:hypothetical protein
LLTMHDELRDSSCSNLYWFRSNGTKVNGVEAAPTGKQHSNHQYGDGHISLSLAGLASNGVRFRTSAHHEACIGLRIRIVDFESIDSRVGRALLSKRKLGEDLAHARTNALMARAPGTKPALGPQEHLFCTLQHDEIFNPVSS